MALSDTGASIGTLTFAGESGFRATVPGAIAKTGKTGPAIATTPMVRDLVAAKPVRACHPLRATVYVQGRWVHEFGDRNTEVEAHFTDYPSAVFAVSDEGVSRDSAVVGTGLLAEIRRGTAVWLYYDVSIRAAETTHTVSANLQYCW